VDCQERGLRDEDWNDPIDSREEGSQKYATKTANAVAAAAIKEKAKVSVTVDVLPVTSAAADSSTAKKGSNAKVCYCHILSHPSIHLLVCDVVRVFHIYICKSSWHMYVHNHVPNLYRSSCPNYSYNIYIFTAKKRGSQSEERQGERPLTHFVLCVLI
jgi:hypothetical protein